MITQLIVTIVCCFLLSCMKSDTKEVSKIVFETRVEVPGFASEVEELTKKLGQEFNNSNFQEEFESTLSSEEHLEIKNDIIWYYTVTQGEVQDFSYFKFDRTTCNSFCYPRGKRGDPENNYTLDMQFKYNLTLDKKDRKIIMGFDCYKVIIDLYEHLMPDAKIKAYLELYVTDELGIPANPIVNLSSNCLPYFPLEIIKTVSNSGRNSKYITTVKSIDYR